MRPPWKTLFMAAAAVLLAGCEQSELYTGLTEREANEMAAVLRGASIDVSKSTTDNKTWTIAAPKDEFAESVTLLQARGYPREHFDSLGDVFRKQGLVSTPLEEHARLTYGLSQEMAGTISQIDGVVSARVHLSMPAADEFSQTKAPASAAVFIKYDPDIDLTSQVGPIKALVVNSVEGLPYDRVSVVLSPARTLSPPPTPPSYAPPLGKAVAAVVGSVICLAMGAAWLRRRSGRPTNARPA